MEDGEQLGVDLPLRLHLPGTPLLLCFTLLGHCCQGHHVIELSQNAADRAAKPGPERHLLPPAQNQSDLKCTDLLPTMEQAACCAMTILQGNGWGTEAQPSSQRTEWHLWNHAGLCSSFNAMLNRPALKSTCPGNTSYVRHLKQDHVMMMLITCPSWPQFDQTQHMPVRKQNSHALQELWLGRVFLALPTRAVLSTPAPMYPVLDTRFHYLGPSMGTNRTCR